LASADRFPGVSVPPSRRVFLFLGVGVSPKSGLPAGQAGANHRTPPGMVGFLLIRVNAHRAEMRLNEGHLPG